jgi:hypothetical protein
MRRRVHSPRSGHNAPLPWRTRLKVAAYTLAPTALHDWLGVRAGQSYWRDGIYVNWEPPGSDESEIDASAYPTEWLSPIERHVIDNRPQSRINGDGGPIFVGGWVGPAARQPTVQVHVTTDAGQRITKEEL